jgi:hypothetical protein
MFFAGFAGHASAEESWRCVVADHAAWLGLDAGWLTLGGGHRTLALAWIGAPPPPAAAGMPLSPGRPAAPGGVSAGHAQPSGGLASGGLPSGVRAEAARAGGGDVAVLPPLRLFTTTHGDRAWPGSGATLPLPQDDAGWRRWLESPPRRAASTCSCRSAPSSRWSTPRARPASPSPPTSGC